MSKIKSSINLGMAVKCRFNEIYSLEPELMYSQPRVRIYASNVDNLGSGYISKTSIDLKLEYFNLPVLLKVSPFANRSVYLTIGPQVGYLMAAHWKEKKISHSFQSNCNRIDLSGVVGIGYDFDFGLQLDVRYFHGFTKLIKSSSVLSEELINCSNSALQLSVGWEFDLSNQ